MNTLKHYYIAVKDSDSGSIPGILQVDLPADDIYKMSFSDVEKRLRDLLENHFDVEVKFTLQKDTIAKVLDAMPQDISVDTGDYEAMIELSETWMF